MFRCGVNMMVHNYLMELQTLISADHVERLIYIDWIRLYAFFYPQELTAYRHYTIEEEHELNMIETGLKHDDANKCWTINYPWKRNPSELPNNIQAVIGRLRSTEQRLKKTGDEHTQEYQKQIDDMVQRKAARKLSPEEVTSYKGPVHYLPHHEVLKPESSSTPLRIVFNSSASYMGHVINDYWAKGPKVLNDLLSILLKFRENQVGLVGDISKMYNSIHLSIEDQHTHRFLWRNCEIDRPPDHYVLTSVPFGDRPSGAIAIIALNKTAEMLEDVYPKAASVIKNNSYVDDILASDPTFENVLQLAKDINQVLDFGGFHIKHWIISGDHHQEIDEINIMNTESEKVLGLVWKPVDDVFTFKVRLNFSRKTKHKSHEEKSTNKSEEIPENLTRRMVLSQVAGVYDPLGLIVPYTLSAKSLIRNLCQGNQSKSEVWDKPLSAEMRQQWIEFFNGLFQLESLCIPRCLKPTNVFGNPVLVLFSDGSNLVFGACAYIRWETAWDIYDVRLIFAKNRIAPVKQLSIPRLELCGAVLSARIREKIVESMTFTFQRVIHLTDSAIVRAQIQKESYGFGTFVANRIAEIQSKTQKAEWFWIPSDQNPADLTTRITHPSILNNDSRWQKGPEFLHYPIEQWPMKQTVDVSEIPDSLVHSVLTEIIEVKPKESSTRILELIDTTRISSLNKLYRLTGILQLIFKAHSFKKILKNVTAEVIREAEKAWILHAQMDLPNNVMQRFRRLGPERTKDGIITVGQRMSKWIEETWNQSTFALLPTNHEFTEYV
ncbi:uncharacterized protein LOC134279607 [Saccostrea cucullata]|uniref:uncharacterized protein LOC134279607 n=1 Tax=Saccostrea cuccullata TaxID=36930 RepID=UPI002ED4671B